MFILIQPTPPPPTAGQFATLADAQAALAAQGTPPGVLIYDRETGKAFDANGKATPLPS